MSYVELEKCKDSPIWITQEQTRLIHSFPFHFDPSLSDLSRNLALDLPCSRVSGIGHVLCCDSPKTHIGPFLNAVDFLIPDGTVVLASHDGVVKCVLDVFDHHGDSADFNGFTNFISINHGNNGTSEISQYAHLAQGSTEEFGIKMGMEVKKGQPLARVGKTGWITRDHLTFIVFRNDFRQENPFTFISLKIRFAEE
jgi:hypothetical protein